MTQEWKKPKRDPRQVAKDKRRKAFGQPPAIRKKTYTTFTEKSDDNFFKGVIGIAGGIAGCWFLGGLLSLSLIGFGIWVIISFMQFFGVI